MLVEYSRAAPADAKYPSLHWLRRAGQRSDRAPAAAPTAAMDKLAGAVKKVQAANIIEKGSSTEAPSSVMVAVRCRPCTCCSALLRQTSVMWTQASAAGSRACGCRYD